MFISNYILYFTILNYIIYNYFTYHSPNPRTNQPININQPSGPQAPGDVVYAATCGHATADALSGTHLRAESR